MAQITLEELAEATEKKYAPFDIVMGEAGVCRLEQSIRLPDDKTLAMTRLNKEFQALQDTTEREDEDGNLIELSEEEQLAVKPKMVAILCDMFRTVAADKDKVEMFLELKGDDLPFLLTTFEKYAESSQLGEASASSSS